MGLFVLEEESRLVCVEDCIDIHTTLNTLVQTTQDMNEKM